VIPEGHKKWDSLRPMHCSTYCWSPGDSKYLDDTAESDIPSEYASYTSVGLVNTTLRDRARSNLVYHRDNAFLLMVPGAWEDT